MVASAIAGGIGLLGASMSAKAAKKAAAIQAASAAEATAESRRQYDQSRADMLPWLETGQRSLADLERELGSEFKESEGYKFAVREGEKGVLSNLSALGMTNSGAALKRLTEFREGLASQDYDTWYNRKAGLAGAGQTQSSSLAHLGQTFANQNAQNQNFLGAAKASGYVGAANAWNSGMEQVAGALGAMRRPNQGFLGGGASPFNYQRMLSGAGGLY